MDEARAVIARLDRIEAMERARASAELMLEQLSLLVGEVELWLRREGEAATSSRPALERCLEALERAPAGASARRIR